jgi:hypothetical protein
MIPQQAHSYLELLNVKLAPNTYILGISNDLPHVQHIIETPFLNGALPNREHRLFTDFMMNLEADVLNEYEHKFKISVTDIWSVFEIITDSKGEKIYQSWNSSFLDKIRN